MGTVQGRPCELAWEAPFWWHGRLVVGVTDSDSSSRSMTVHSADELLATIRRISGEVWDQFGVWVAVCLGDLANPYLYAALVGDRWHFWYLADKGNVSLVSVGDESEPGSTPVIVGDFDEVLNAELVSNDVGEEVVREWYEAKRLSDKVRWREK